MKIHNFDTLMRALDIAALNCDAVIEDIHIWTDTRAVDQEYISADIRPAKDGSAEGLAARVAEYIQKNDPNYNPPRMEVGTDDSHEGFGVVELRLVRDKN